MAAATDDEEDDGCDEEDGCDRDWLFEYPALLPFPLNFRSWLSTWMSSLAVMPPLIPWTKGRSGLRRNIICTPLPSI